MQNLIAESKQESSEKGGYYKTDLQTYDQSVSLVKMQDSMQMDMNVTNTQPKKGKQPSHEIILEEANE